MTPETNRQIEPLCKFGPGGDFVAAWQPEPLEISEMSNRFVRLLASLFEVIVVLVEKGSGTFSAKRAPGRPDRKHRIPFLPDDLIVFDREKVIHDAEIRRTGDKAHAKAIAAPENGRTIPLTGSTFDTRLGTNELGDILSGNKHSMWTNDRTHPTIDTKI